MRSLRLKGSCAPVVGLLHTLGFPQSASTVTDTGHVSDSQAATVSGAATRLIDLATETIRSTDVVKKRASKGAKPDVRCRTGKTGADMASGLMVNAHPPMEYPDTVALLRQPGAPVPEKPVAVAPRTGCGAQRNPAEKTAFREKKRTHMNKLNPAIFAVFLTGALSAQTKQPLVDFGLMTWPEVKQALQQGKTTALIFNGGTEQRGPHGVNGAHTLIVHELGIGIARKLGNAILAPVIPYSVNRANAELPGTIGITGPVFAQLNEQVAEQMIVNGFKNVVLMGDHGGGQQELAAVAKKLDEKYAPQGVHVVYCSDVYTKVGADFDKWLEDNGYPAGAHASIKDTSELLYLGGDKGWVRKDLIATAVGDPVRKPGTPRDPNQKRANNGIQGDARRSTPEIGKRVSDMKVDYAVRQIRELLKEQNPALAANQPQ